MMLGEMLGRDELTAGEIESHLDSLSHADRLAQILSLSKKQQVRLWDVAGTVNKKFTSSFLVADDAQPLDPVPFEGKNSLPMFTRFRKVFYRTGQRAIGGYNNQTLEKITGPGYFMVEDSPEGPGPVLVNYLRVPEEKPDGWPKIRPNETGLQRFIYAGMHDYLRWVSKEVVIGRAYDGPTQRPKPNWFVLCRQTTQAGD